MTFVHSCLTAGFGPSSLKYDALTWILKPTSEPNNTNFWPLSNPPLYSRILETIVASQVDHLVYEVSIWWNSPKASLWPEHFVVHQPGWKLSCMCRALCVPAFHPWPQGSLLRGVNLTVCQSLYLRSTQVSVVSLNQGQLSWCGRCAAKAKPCPEHP